VTTAARFEVLESAGVIGLESAGMSRLKVAGLAGWGGAGLTIGVQTVVVGLVLVVAAVVGWDGILGENGVHA